MIDMNYDINASPLLIQYIPSFEFPCCLMKLLFLSASVLNRNCPFIAGGITGSLSKKVCHEFVTLSIRPCVVTSKCLENDFHCACLRTEIFLWEGTLSSMLNPNPKSSHSVDPQFSHKLLFYLH